MRTLYGILLMMAVVWPHHLLAQDQGAVFASLVKRYEHGVQASFVYVMSSDIWDQDLIYSGQILLVDDQYRIETSKELIIGRGLETWIYRPADQQILISRAEEGELAFAPGNLFANYEHNYSAVSVGVEAVDGVPHLVLELAPLIDDAPIRDVWLWIRRADGVISRIECVDNTGTQMTIQIDDVVLGPDVAADAFLMPVPEDVEVIDLR